jgi:hypothetical protein
MVLVAPASRRDLVGFSGVQSENRRPLFHPDKRDAGATTHCGPISMHWHGSQILKTSGDILIGPSEGAIRWFGCRR